MSDIKIMDKPLFIVIFKDSTSYIGKTNYSDTGWKNIPDKPIKRIFFKLVDDNYICLEGYEKYNRITEATKDINGKRAGIVTIQYMYFMGLKNNIVTSYRSSLHEGQKGKDKFMKGDITRREYEFGKEWYNGATSGWK